MDQELYGQVKRSVKSLLNINLDQYKDEQMRRRLDAWLSRSGATSWPAYFRRVRSDPDELARFRNYLTINVSAFFRDPERWQTLRQKVLPELLKARPRLRLWSAGCSVGPEPYSLAIVLDELTPLRRHYLLATDLDRGALDKARARGPFTAEDIQHVTPAERAQYFQPAGPSAKTDGWYVSPSLARRVEFREHNLLADEFEADFDLIICRNVVIYFTEAAKAGLYRKFYAALRPGGLLFVGGTEIISHAQEIGFRNYGISFYQRPDR